MKKTLSKALIISVSAFSISAAIAGGGLPDNYQTGQLFQAQDYNNTNKAVNSLGDVVTTLSDSYGTLSGQVTQLSNNLAAKTSFIRTLTITATTDALVDGTSLANAISNASNLTPTEQNPVLIKLEPGTYIISQDITVPAYVSLEGSGSLTGSVLANTPPTSGVTTIDDSAHPFNLAGGNVISNLVIKSSTAPTLIIGDASNALTGTVSLNNVAVLLSTDATASGIAIDVKPAASNDLFVANNLQVSIPSSSSGAAIQFENASSGTARLYNTTIQASGAVAINILNGTSPNVVYGYNSVINGTIKVPNGVSSTQYFMTNCTLPNNAAVTGIAKCAYGTAYGSILGALTSNCT